MEVREVELKVEKLTRNFKIRKVKEKWVAVRFGDKEFVMTKDVADYFVRCIRRDSIFHLYFDGDKVILDDPYLIRIPIGTNRKNVKEYRFIVVDENTEFWNPDNFTLIAKDEGLALYSINHNDDLMYKDGKRYTIFFNNGKEIKSFSEQTVIFDTEKPLNEETFNLIKRFYYERDKGRHVRYEIFGTGFEIVVFDDDVDVYVGKEHYLLALENAELVKVINFGKEYLAAIKGDKTYIELEKEQQEHDKSSYHKDEKGRYVTYTSRYRIFNYEFNPVNVIKSDKERIIAEVPSLDAEIKIKKFIKNVEPILIDGHPKTWHYQSSEPEFVEEKSRRLRELVRKLSDNDKSPYDYRVEIELAVNV